LKDDGASCALIVRADDFGMCRSVNKAIADCLTRRKVSCAGLIAPARFFDEAARLCRLHPGWDIGVHLTLFGEWTNDPWKPLAPLRRIPSLLNKAGFFHTLPRYLWRQKPPKRQVEREYEAQIRRVFRAGLRPSYLDFHIATLDEYRKLALRLAARYRLLVSGSLGENEVHADFRRSFRLNRSFDAARSLQLFRPGLNITVAHPGYDTAELRRYTIPGQKPGQTARLRQRSFDDLDARIFDHLEKKLGIPLIGYGDLRRTTPHG